MDKNKVVVTNKNLIEPVHKCEHQRYEYIKYELTKRDRDSQCYAALYEIPPGKANYPYLKKGSDVGYYEGE